MLPFGNISKRIFTHTASHYAFKHTTILAIWQARKCRAPSLHLPQKAASEAMPPVRKQSAAEQTSLAPHGVGRGCNMTRFAEDSWRSHVHRTYIAQRVQPFKPQARNVGGRGERPSSFSGGYKGGILFEKRIPPLIVQRRGAAIPLRTTLSPEARSCRGRREHENADAARSVPPARRCWTRRGNSQCPSPW